MIDLPSTLALQPKQRRVLTDDVADAIREAILTGELAGGARLIEDELANSLKVSRGPVRQAIFRLQQEGLVVHETHRGATVANVSLEDAEEIYSLRGALERLAIERVCHLATPDQLVPLRTVLHDFKATPRGQMTKKRAAELDIDFHETLFRAAHNQRLQQAWERLRSQVYLFLLLRDMMPDDFTDTWHREHLDMLHLIEARDAPAAVRYMERHIGSAFARLERTLKSASPTTGNAV